jgi:hypothetical protein
VWVAFLIGTVAFIVLALVALIQRGLGSRQRRS